MLKKLGAKTVTNCNKSSWSAATSYEIFFLEEIDKKRL